MNKYKPSSIGFTDTNLFRLCFYDEEDNNSSYLYQLGFIDKSLSEIKFPSVESASEIKMKTGSSSAIYNKEQSCLTLEKNDIPGMLELYLQSDGSFIVKKEQTENFYGFGFQRKTFGADGQKLEFRKGYRWDQATVPFFISSRGYGIFSANTFNHTFDFTGKAKYQISIAEGYPDLYVFLGPSFKNIISSYTALTGRPVMIPRWSFGLCYAARLFESQKGLLEIAKRFRKEGIPCDMIGVEPGWEEHYYQMKWEWSKKLFPTPAKMLEELHELGYAFELWDSGDAPISGFIDSENRKNWFSKRIASSTSLGVDFFKQDDPYPRCITTEEMVTDPDISVLIDDMETINIANTLYSETIFNEIRKLTDKRTMIIFHSYASSFSSHRYPVVWAGDFKLGNGAVNASLSGHAMVTQDMRSEVPDGIHFGFLLPFTFMDSWAYYLEPWLFTNHIKDMIKFYSRLRSSLFPYLYSTFRIAHETGIPMLRPMILEFQDDPAVYSIDDQFMLGNSFLVCATPERDTKVYLPKGKWINYWTGEEILSSGEYIRSDWPEYAGGALYVKKGAIITKCPAMDSLSEYKNDILIIEAFPNGCSETTVYEDDGISYAFEKEQYAKTTVSCEKKSSSVFLKIGKTQGSYDNMPESKKYLIKVYSQYPPKNVELNGSKLLRAESLDTILYSKISGWFYDCHSKFVYIKPHYSWNIVEKITDIYSLYGFSTDDNPFNNQEFNISLLFDSVISNPPYQKAISATNHSGRFAAVINPPERVRLNHGDNWLPYYIYVGFEIVDKENNRVKVDTTVHLDIVTSEGNHITRSTQTYNGVGNFKRIDLAPPGIAVTADITLSCKGITPLNVSYRP